MVILQTEVAHDAIQQTFSIDPGTVYGVFAGVMLLFIFALGYGFVRMGKWASAFAKDFLKGTWDDWKSQHKIEWETKRADREQDRQDRIKEAAERAERDRQILDAIAQMSAVTQGLKQRIDGLDRRMERLEDKV